MLDVRTQDDVYPAVDELVSALNLLGETNLAAKLQHRVQVVAWTARSELFDELRKILGSIDATSLPPELARQVRALVNVLDTYLTQWSRG